MYIYTYIIYIYIIYTHMCVRNGTESAVSDFAVFSRIYSIAGLGCCRV